MRYNIQFIPKLEDRKKITPLKYKLCKETKSNDALRYPIHISLISGGFLTKKYDLFEKELKEICKNQKIMSLKPHLKTDILKNIGWSGIHFSRTKEIKDFQIKLQELRNKFALKKEEHYFRPLHLTLAFNTNVDNLKQIKTPIEKLDFDRITIVKRKNDKSKYKIHKHIKLGKKQ